jgi:hypothetical protein
MAARPAGRHDPAMITLFLSHAPLWRPTPKEDRRGIALLRLRDRCFEPALLCQEMASGGAEFLFGLETTERKGGTGGKGGSLVRGPLPQGPLSPIRTDPRSSKPNFICMRPEAANKSPGAFGNPGLSCLNKDFVRSSLPSRVHMQPISW